MPSILLIHDEQEINSLALYPNRLKREGFSAGSNRELGKITWRYSKFHVIIVILYNQGPDWLVVISVIFNVYIPDMPLSQDMDMVQHFGISLYLSKSPKKKSSKVTHSFSVSSLH
jgi:hypothetical protein